MEMKMVDFRCCDARKVAVGVMSKSRDQVWPIGWTLDSKWVVRIVSRNPGGWYIVVSGKRISFATAHVYQALKRPVGADGRFWYRNW